MPEFIDYSSRRGAIVPLLPSVHALLKELAKKDKHYLHDAPEDLVLWRHKMEPLLLDISRRFLFALEMAGTRRTLLGFLFYRYEGNDIYIEDKQLAWRSRSDMAVSHGLINKLERDPRAKDAVFYANDRLRKPVDKEILAAAGFKETIPGGWEKMGGINEVTAALKQRYNRGKA